APGDRVVFARKNCFVFGRFYRLPIDTDLQNQLLLDANVSPSKITELRNSSNTTWLVAVRVKSDNHVDRSRKCLRKLARAYGVKVNEEELRQHLGKFHFTVARMNVNGIEFSSRHLKP